MNNRSKIDLELIDQFQQRFGLERTIERARHFMIAYVYQIRRPLPPLAAQGWELANQSRCDTTTRRQERIQTITALWEYIIRHEGSVSSPDPACCIMRALIWLLLDDNWSPYISEEMHWFLYFAEKFEDHSDRVQSLIEEHFASELKTS
jgi:hypothetical protein